MTFSASCFDFAQHDPQPGPLSQSGFHFQARADQVCAFADSEQAEMSARGEVCGAIRHLKADTVIADFEFAFSIGKVDVEHGLFGEGFQFLERLPSALVFDGFLRELHALFRAVRSIFDHPYCPTDDTRIR